MRRGAMAAAIVSAAATPAARGDTADARAAPPAQERGIARWFDPDTAPFLPIPEIDASPFSGVTLGLIPVVLTTNDRGEIDRILAPDIIRSAYFGWGARWRTFRNPSDDERWSVVGGAKQRVESEFDAEFDGGLRRDRDWSWTLHAMYDRSGTGRFFGIGNDASQSAATTYVDAQSRLEATVGRNFGRRLQVAYSARADVVRIDHGVLAGLPSIESRYPGLPGLGGEHELQERVVASYDTRDAATIPRDGSRVAAYAGFSRRGLASSVSYTFLGVDASVVRPLDDGLTLALHGAVRYMPDDRDAPFWALSSVGGDRSVIGEAQPLRAFGPGRFVDRNAADGTIELRLRALAFHMFSTDLSFEPAPFVDVGKVFARMGDNPVAHAHHAVGIGLRIVASPFVVGYLDVGYGRDGVAVFSGIDYPF